MFRESTIPKESRTSAFHLPEDCVKPTTAALGFTVKSGWASAVVLAGADAQPELVSAARVELSDPADADARQPYHDGFATMRKEGPALTRLLASVKTFGRREVRNWIRAHQKKGYTLRGSGIVAGSLIDPTHHRQRAHSHPRDGRAAVSRRHR